MYNAVYKLFFQSNTRHNHQAVNGKNAKHNHLDSTRIGACACARHGCFIPHSVVDFQKGEQHKNIDYSICNALQHNTEGFDSALVIYDIGCQWSINIVKRIRKCTGLIMTVEELLVTIGKFHLSAHIADCFTRFSLNFMKGAGQVDGKILETLWSAFNKIAGSARTMTAAGRQEIYDNFMRDSNWKKLVGSSMNQFYLLHTLLSHHIQSRR